VIQYNVNNVANAGHVDVDFPNVRRGALMVVGISGIGQGVRELL